MQKGRDLRTKASQRGPQSSPWADWKAESPAQRGLDPGSAHLGQPTPGSRGHTNAAFESHPSLEGTRKSAPQLAFQTRALWEQEVTHTAPTPVPQQGPRHCRAPLPLTLGILSITLPWLRWEVQQNVRDAFFL